MKKKREFGATNKITELIQSHPTIQLAYIFGSSVKDSIGDPSDIDIAILLKRRLLRGALMVDVNLVKRKLV